MQNIWQFAVLLLMSAAAWGQEAPGAIYRGQPGNPVQALAREQPPGARLRSPAQYRLPNLSNAERRRARKQTLPQIGVRRALSSNAQQSGVWSSLPDGRRVWRFAISSPQASALRVHFENFAAGSGKAWVYAQGPGGGITQMEGPFSGNGPLGDGDFWTGAIPGSSIIVEYVEAMPGASGNQVPFTIDAISHLWGAALAPPAQEIDPSGPKGLPPVFAELALEGMPTPPSAFSALAPSAGDGVGTQAAAGYCNLDVTCYAAYKETANAVVQYSFISDDGGSYVCSGSMINTRSSSFKPYLLTANHCISSNAEARSIQAYFFYQTSVCNGPAPSKFSLPTVVGGTYLAGADMTHGDYSLVLLASNPPGGTYFLGWSASSTDFAVGGNATGIHHPNGDFKRISFGTRLADRNNSISGQALPSALYYVVGWSQGVTEVGSSGSPLLNATNQIIGTLTYGPLVNNGQTVCDLGSSQRSGGYGRFSNTYEGIRNFLEDTASPSITVSSTALTFTMINGQYSGPSTQTLTLRTTSTTAIPYTLTLSAPWIRQSQSSSTISSASPATVTVSIDPASFTRNTNTTGTIIIASGTLTPISVGITANITVSTSTVGITLNPNPVYQQAADSDGYTFFYSVVLTESSGIGTRVTSFRIGGTDYSANIASWFGSDQLPASGTLTGSLRTRGLTLPSTQIFTAGGTDASGRTWTTQVSVPFLAKPATAVLTMDSAPSIIRQNPNSSNCPWYQQLVLTEVAGLAVNLTSFTADLGTLTDSLASYWSGTQVPANGTLRGGICWTNIQLPASITVRIQGTDSTGAAVSAAATAVFSGPAANPATMSVSGPSVVLAAPVGYTSAVNSDLTLSLESSTTSWTGRLLFSRNANSSWLSVSPLSGIGSKNLRISAPAGSAAGTYDATLVLQSIDAVPQLINIPIKLVVGASATGPVINPAGLVNNASYRAQAAPGMIMTVFGQMLASGTQLATSLPLPTTMQNTRATINGRPAPLYYVSPLQINLQVPYATEIGTATLTITVNGQSSSQQFPVSATAPGVYTSNGRSITPMPRLARGDYGLLYITGQGGVFPAVNTGEAPSISTPIEQLPAPIFALAMTVGGVPARVTFGAIPYFLVGVTQINFQLSPNTPVGEQPVVIRLGEKLSVSSYMIVD